MLDADKYYPFLLIEGMCEREIILVLVQDREQLRPLKHRALWRAQLQPMGGSPEEERL